MKNLLLLFVLLISACAKPAYTEPTIGMSMNDLITLCGNDAFAIGETHTVTDANGTAFTVKIDKAPEGRPSSCFGKFVFINNKLNSITR